MIPATALALVDEVFDAHGGAALAAAEHLDVSFSSGGLAFAAKWQASALTDVHARLHPHRQRITLTGTTPRPWSVAVNGTHDLKTRLAALRSGARRLRWQPEDLGAFAAAAIWTYLTLPLLIRQAEHAQRLPDLRGARRLRIRVPDSLGGHSDVQTVHVGADGLIRRHDYTATAFGPWASATQDIARYQAFDGVPVGTDRVVTPRYGRPLPGPTLVWIRIHSVDRTAAGTTRPSGDPRRARRSEQC